MFLLVSNKQKRNKPKKKLLINFCLILRKKEKNFSFFIFYLMKLKILFYVKNNYTEKKFPI